jgi:glycosyltransferase involved in cell wall biosynthesis
LLKVPGIDFIGEIGDREKGVFLGEAMALLFPIDWPEPFGLVMIEAMANGTPVIGFRRGAVPEVIDEGVTGFLVDSADDALAGLPCALALDRKRIRRRFEERFSAERMARDYVALYEGALNHAAGNALVLASTMDQPARDAA